MSSCTSCLVLVGIYCSPLHNIQASIQEEMSDLESLLEYNEIVKKLFANEEEGFQFYNNYGFEKEFSVRRSYCEWDNGHNEMTLRKFVCSRQGFREEKQLKRAIKKRKPRNITRVGCLAKFVTARDHITGHWYVKDFIDEHNHPMAQQSLLVCYVHIEESAMSRKLRLWRWRVLGSANTR